MHRLFDNKKAFTMVELLVSMGIFGLIVSAAAWLLVNGLRSNAVIWDQLSSQNDGRRVIQQVVNDVRRAERSSIGSYPIAIAEDYELVFYANIDTDIERERVRFWLDNTTLKKGVINPTGNPPTYVTSTEQVVEIGHFLVNIAKGQSLFDYFDQFYSGTSTPLLQPVSLTDIRVVRVQLEIEEDPDKTPIPLHVESTVQIRNLKGN